MIPLFLRDVAKVVEFIETELEGWLPGAWEREGAGNYYLMGMAFQSCKMERVLDMDGSDGCTPM